MSPDLEWKVDDASGQQTAGKTSSNPPSRWRPLLVVLMLALGITLGVLYSSIPEPPQLPRPTSTPVNPDSLITYERITHTLHFEIVYHELDRPYVSKVASYFEEVYNRACLDLGCEIDPMGNFPHEITITLILQAQVDQPTFDYVSKTITLPSPSIHSVYFQDLQAINLKNDSVIDNIALRALPGLIARISSGGSERWNQSRKGDLLVGNIGQWERFRLQSDQFPADQSAFDSLRSATEILPLDRIWNAEPPYDSQDVDVLASETWAFIRFIDHGFGADGVRRFLVAMGTAQSISETVEKGLGVKYAEFEQQWSDWLAQNLSSKN